MIILMYINVKLSCMSFEKEQYVGVGEITNPLYREVRDLDYLLSLAYPKGVPQIMRSELRVLCYELLQEVSSLRYIVASLPNKDDAAELIKHYLVQRTQTKVDHKTALHMAKVRMLTKGKDGVRFTISAYKENEEFVKKHAEFVDFAFHALRFLGGFSVVLREAGDKKEKEYYISVKRNAQSVSSFDMTAEEFRTTPAHFAHRSDILNRYFFGRAYIGLDHDKAVRMADKIKV